MPKLTKSKKSEIPVMISGLSIGISLKKLITCFLRPFILNIPIAATEPSRVEAEAEIRAMLNVFLMASSNEWCAPPLKSEV